MDSTSTYWSHDPMKKLLLRLTLIPRTEQLGLNTGSVTSLRWCGSSAWVLMTNRCPLGPLA